MTAGRPISPKQQKPEKDFYFYIVSELRVPQTYKILYLNKHFKKLAIRVSAQLRQRICPGEQNLYLFTTQVKNMVSVHGVQVTTRRLIALSWLRFCQKNTTSSQQFWCHSQLHQMKWDDLWCEQNRSLTLPSQRLFIS